MLSIKEDVSHREATAYKNKAVEQRTVDVQASTSNVRNASPGTTLSNNNISQGGNVVKEGSISLAERLEAQSLNNEPITVEDVKKATVFGDEGSKLVAELANNDGVTFSQAERAVKTAYMAGFANVESSKVSFETDTQIDAFTAGKKDRAMQDLAAKENAKNATVYDGAFTENEYTKDFSDAERTMISTVVKGLKMDISVVDKIIANVVEGRIYEADAEHKDGKMQISSTTEKLLYEILMHEGGHRMEQLAPAEFGVLMDALYERAEGRSIRLGVSQGLVLDSVKAQHDNAGIMKDTRGYMEEFAVRELETIFGSPEEFNKWYAEISGNQQVKTAWEKFISWLSEVIEDIKKAWSQRNMTAEEKAEAKKAAAELERIKGLLASTVKAAENAAQKRASEARSENVHKDFKSESTKDFNLKKTSITQADVENDEMLQKEDAIDLTDDKDLSVRIENQRGSKKYKIIRDYILETLGEQPIVLSDGIVAKVDKSDALHLANKSANRKTAYISKIKAIIEQAKFYAVDTKVEHNKFDEFRYYQAKVKYGDEMYPVYLNVGRSKNGDGYHIYDITRKIGAVAKQKNALERVENDLRSEIDSPISKKIIPQTEEKSQEKVEDVFKEDKAVKRDFRLKEENAQYTDQEYRDFGWARDNGILSADQNVDYRSKFAMAKSGQMKFPKSKKGEFIIPVSDIYDSDKEGINNVLVFAKGTIDKPIVTSIIEIYEYDETSLDRIRRRIYDCERRGIQQEAGELFERYDAVDYELRPNQQRIGSESVGNSSDNGYGEGSRGETSSIKGETRVNYSLKGGVSGTELLDTIEGVQKGEKEALNKLSRYADGGVVSTELYNKLIEKYGAIPKGEKPARDIDVPRKTADGRKVSQTVRTILEAKATPDEAIPSIEKMVTDGEFFRIKLRMLHLQHPQFNWINLYIII